MTGDENGCVEINILKRLSWNSYGTYTTRAKCSNLVVRVRVLPEHPAQSFMVTLSRVATKPV